MRPGNRCSSNSDTHKTHNTQDRYAHASHRKPLTMRPKRRGRERERERERERKGIERKRERPLH